MIQAGGLMDKIRLLELADRDVLLKVLEIFNSSTDLNAFIVDLEGNPLVSGKHPLESCSFCKIIRKDPKMKMRCSEAYARAGKLAASISEPYIFRCPAGLIEWAAPILFQGCHLGTIICGQVLMWEPEDFFWIELSMMIKHYDIELAQLIAAAQKLPVISGKKVQAAADLLFIMANHIVKTSIIGMNQQKQLEQQDMLLRAEIKARKILENALKKQNAGPLSFYSLKKEKELLAKIKMGDIPQVLAALQGILTDCLKQYEGNFELLKTRLMELLVIISRTLMEKGGEEKKLLELNHFYTRELAALSSPDQILPWFPAIIEQYIKSGRGYQDSQSQVVKQVVDYLHANYHLNLKLDDIARTVHLSPYYLSHLFKEETGYTIVEYLTKVRMEEAKKLLENSLKTVQEIASSTGFNNTSYFSKLFRSREGLTPLQYRQTVVKQ